MATEQPQGHDGLVSEKTAEILMAAFMFMVGIVITVANYQLGAGWAKDGPESGYFPFRIGIIICIAAVTLLVQTLRAKSAPKAFVTRAKLKPVLLVLLPTLVYVGATEFIGIYVASAIFVAGFMRMMDKYSWTMTLSVSVGMNVLLFWMFELQFMVPLPKGPLEAYFGY